MLLIELFAINISTIFLILFGGILGIVVFSIVSRNKKIESKLKQTEQENSIKAKEEK